MPFCLAISRPQVGDVKQPAIGKTPLVPSLHCYLRRTRRNQVIKHSLWLFSYYVRVKLQRITIVKETVKLLSNFQTKNLCPALKLYFPHQDISILLTLKS